MRRMVRKACLLHYTSKREQEVSAEYLRGVKSEVVPNAVKVSEFNRAIPQLTIEQTLKDILDSRFILFLGRLDPKKKLELLIRSFCQLPERKKYQLVIAGDGEANYAARLKELANNSPIPGHIKFVGWVKDDLKVLLLQFIKHPG